MILKEGIEIANLANLQSKMDKVLGYLKKNDYSFLPISASELVSYFEGDAPSGDTITLAMVLESKWLFIHELIELSELKRMGFSISSQLLFDNPSEVFFAHLIAVEWELALSFREGDHLWVKNRLKDIENWLTDPLILPGQVLRCQQLISKYIFLISNP